MNGNNVTLGASGQPPTQASSVVDVVGHEVESDEARARRLAPFHREQYFANRSSAIDESGGDVYVVLTRLVSDSAALRALPPSNP